MQWDAEYDVVVAGSGIAGLSAALAAHEAGLQTVVVEKADRLGGSTTYSYGLIWIPLNHLELSAGYADSREDVLQYMRFFGGGQHIEERVQKFIDHSSRAAAFYARQCGIRFRIVKGIRDFYHGQAPGTRAEGRTIEHDLISGGELGDWRKLLLLPDTTPYALTAEEMIEWGGINNFAEWDTARRPSAPGAISLVLVSVWRLASSKHWLTVGSRCWSTNRANDWWSKVAALSG